MSGYVVAVKNSARRANGVVGRLVFESGAHHHLANRAAADAWAASLSARGGVHVWIRDANPGDDDADGYLVRRRGAWRERTAEGPMEEVAGLGRFEV
ncbi:MAG: hypothetical protein ABEJ68_06310 [Halobacteriaceae archaeon]